MSVIYLPKNVMPKSEITGHCGTPANKWGHGSKWNVINRKSVKMSQNINNLCLFCRLLWWKGCCCFTGWSADFGDVLSGGCWTSLHTEVNTRKRSSFSSSPSNTESDPDRAGFLQDIGNKVCINNNDASQSCITILNKYKDKRASN